jgi:hypothetical protein
MDRLRLRRRLRRLLAVGAILAALAYLGTMANRARLSWLANRAEAELEDGWAGAEGLNASNAGRHAEQFRRQGRMAEAEQWAKYMESFRQRESLHRRKSQELLSRWW